MSTWLSSAQSKRIFALSTAIMGMFLPGIACAQLENLQITEVMFNPSASSERQFEWVEVRNTGAASIDLDGYTFRDFNNFVPVSALPIPPNIVSVANGGPTTNTSIPGGNGVAVLYNGFSFGYDDSRFRAGWNLPSTVPLIAVDFFPSLNNSGDDRQVGLWETIADYEADAPILDTNDPPDGEDDGRVVSGFANAALNLNYTTAAGYPSGAGAENNGKSITWTGNGSINDGANWVLSESGVNGAITSVDTFLPGGTRRNGEDFASPNQVPPGPAASGLLITEFMADPGEGPGQTAGAGNADFEWIEIFNNTGANLDLAGFVLDDAGASSDALAAANIAAGSIANGETAVLFDNGTVSIADMVTIWGAGNYVPVSDWLSLGNGGDTFALWSSLANYQLDNAGTQRTFDNAEAVLTYDDAANDWPDVGGGSSLYLTDLSTANGNDSSGTSADGTAWDRSANDFGPPDGPGQAGVANALFSDMVTDYVAGDVGSPGSFATVVVSDLLGDYNEDNVVDAADYTVWRDNLGATGGLPNNGTLGDTVDATYYDLWKSNFGATAGSGSLSAGAVPEPAAAVSLAMAVLGGLFWSRRKLG